jgi:hypothetical protein
MGQWYLIAEYSVIWRHQIHLTHSFSGLRSSTCLRELLLLYGVLLMGRVFAGPRSPLGKRPLHGRIMSSHHIYNPKHWVIFQCPTVWVRIGEMLGIVDKCWLWPREIDIIIDTSSAMTCTWVKILVGTMMTLRWQGGYGYSVGKTFLRYGKAWWFGNLNFTHSSVPELSLKVINSTMTYHLSHMLYAMNLII